MQTLHYTITINAPREKVWNVMLDDATYREWTSVFHPGSYYKGSWDKGSKILFIGPDPETGKEGGMVARIKENRLHEYVSIEQYGEIQDGVEKPWGEGVLIYENYTFTDKDGSTEVAVELTNIPDEYAKILRVIHIHTLNPSTCVLH